MSPTDTPTPTPDESSPRGYYALNAPEIFFVFMAGFRSASATAHARLCPDESDAAHVAFADELADVLKATPGAVEGALAVLTGAIDGTGPREGNYVYRSHGDGCTCDEGEGGAS